MGKHLDFFHGSIDFPEDKLIHSFKIYQKKNSLKIFRPLNSIVLIDQTKIESGLPFWCINFEWTNVKNRFGVSQCIKQQHCTYNRITEGFQLWGCTENGIK